MSTEYKEDSTKGSSVINPLNYKGDVLVQTWVDSRVLATLCKWLDTQGVHSQHMSQVVRKPLEILVAFLVDNGDVSLVDDTLRARNILSTRFGIDLNRGGRGNKNVQHNIVLSSRRQDLSEIVRLSKGDDINRPMGTDNALTDKAVGLYDSIAPRGKTLFDEEGE